MISNSVTIKGFNVIVVDPGYRLYKEDGSDDFLEVKKGQAVKNLHSVYVVEEDFRAMKEYIDQQETNDAIIA